MCRGDLRSPAFILPLKFFVCQQIRCTPCSATEKIPASKIRQSRHYPSERDVHFYETKIASLPYNPEITANSEQRANAVRPYNVSGKFYLRKIAPLGAYAQLWSALPIPHSSLLIPHLNAPLCNLLYNKSKLCSHSRKKFLAPLLLFM